MLRTLLHLGPGKCGSTTITTHLRHLGDVQPHLLTFLALSGREVQELEDGVPATCAAIAARIGAVPANRVLMISHEVLFKKHAALRWLARAAVKRGGDVCGLAYLRPQSEFLRSSFGQWLFRMPDRLAETALVLKDHGIDPALFTGVERHLTAVALGHPEVGRQPGGQSYFDWAESIPRVAAVLRDEGARLVVSAVPKRDAQRTLIADMMDITGLPGPTAPQSGRALVNPSFSPQVIEAVCRAIEFGLSVPGRHDGNQWLVQAAPLLEAMPLPPTMFLNQLQIHLDAIYAERNARLAAEYGIDPDYFAAPKPCSDLMPLIEIEVVERGRVPQADREATRRHWGQLISDAWLDTARS